MLRSVDIHVTGTVQGVGFRPFVYRIARRNLVCGWVLNATDGVHIHAEGDEGLVGSFLSDLETDAPAASRITGIEVEDVPVRGFSAFEIRESERESGGAGSGAGTGTGGPGASTPAEAKRTRISPDLATCPDCLVELFDEDDRRFHYPFVNCTNCGPRFTIIEELPYDRPATSMREFEMCPECAGEYADPADRRFHAQPDACFECGPSLTLTMADGSLWEAAAEDPDDAAEGLSARRMRSDALLERVAEMLREGKTVAIKGLGGYHLACNATDEEAVSRLRERKRRYGKPLAIMVRDAEEASRICRVSNAEAELLGSPAAPIVLLERRPSRNLEHPDVPGPGAVAPSVAGTLHELGVMLPYTPVQHMLMHLVDFPLVMTSGNFTEEPIVSGNEDAHRLLSGVCDAFLDNDRKIVSRYDDSVVRMVDGRVQVVRRARGYAPSPLPLPDFACENAPAVLATGPQLKSTFALVAEGDSAAAATAPAPAHAQAQTKPVDARPSREALVSQHIGDLENAETMDSWQQTLGLYERMFAIEPQMLACDMHPEYLASKWARSSASEEGLPLVEVQHHHAHIAAVLAENIAAGACAADEKVVGIALDGTGYGDDGTIWGGEVLVCDCAGYERVAHLQNMTVAGGDQAVLHPSRLAFSLLSRDGLLEHPGAARLIDGMEPGMADVLPQMLEHGINCVETSSTGRFLDAVAALLGICFDASYDGEAPALLEAAAYDQDTCELLEDPGSEEAAGRYAMELVPESSDGADSDRVFDASSGKVVDGGNDGDIGGGTGGGIGEAGTNDGTPARCGCLQIRTSTTVRAVLDDIVADVPAGIVSLRVHRALAHAMAEACSAAAPRISDMLTDDDASGGLPKVALSGGVFMNRIVLTTTIGDLENRGFEVLLPRELPPNDGCIAYGQLAVASARAAERSRL